MRNAIYWILLGMMCVVAQPNNTNSWLDTSWITGINADSVRYTEWRPLSKFEDILLQLAVDDTGEAGYADDSVYLTWSYQVGMVSVDSSGDTAIVPGLEVLIDSVNSAHFGTRTVGYTDSLGLPNISLLGVDTLALDGWAIMQRAVVPFWAPFWRQKVAGVTGNNVSDPVKIRFQESRRIYVPVQDK